MTTLVCDQDPNQNPALEEDSKLPFHPVLPFPDCGQILTARNGVISSPGYPTYRHNQRCGWIIALGKGYGLRIKIEVSVKQGSVITNAF